MIRIIRFETEYRVGKDPVDWVLVAPIGEDFQKTQTWHRVHKINPENVPLDRREGNSYADMKAKWSVIGPAYEAWKEGSKVSETGTPLESWAGVTSQQVKLLKELDVRSVEEVRDMGDGIIAKLRFPNARQLPKLAKDYLEGQSVAEKDAEIAEMRERMAAMEELLNQQAETKKRGPGRPKKEPEAA